MVRLEPNTVPNTEHPYRGVFVFVRRTPSNNVRKCSVFAKNVRFYQGAVQSEQPRLPTPRPLVDAGALRGYQNLTAIGSKEALFGVVLVGPVGVGFEVGCFVMIDSRKDENPTLITPPPLTVLSCSMLSSLAIFGLHVCRALSLSGTVGLLTVTKVTKAIGGGVWQPSCSGGLQP